MRVSELTARARAGRQATRRTSRDAALGVALACLLALGAVAGAAAHPGGGTGPAGGASHAQGGPGGQGGGPPAAGHDHGAGAHGAEQSHAAESASGRGAPSGGDASESRAGAAHAGAHGGGSHGGQAEHGPGSASEPKHGGHQGSHGGQAEHGPGSASEPKHGGHQGAHGGQAGSATEAKHGAGPSGKAHKPQGEASPAQAPEARQQATAASVVRAAPRSAATAAQPAATAQSAAAAAAPTAAPSVAAPSAALSPAPAAAPGAATGTRGRARSRGRGRTRTARRTGAGRHPGSGARRAGAVLSKAGATPIPARALPARRAAKGSRQDASAAGALRPVVRTITRIVGIVPEPVRILIGALLALVAALALRSRLSHLRARRLERQRAQLLEDVGLLQAALLPVPPVRLGLVATSVAYRPADGPGAGGDFYDLFALESGQLAVIVGDVSGHGRAALPHTALVRFTLRAYLEAGLAPREALRTAAAVLERQLGDSFVTVAAATYEPRERLLTYACAGHPPPIVLGSRALEPITGAASPPLGTGAPTGLRQTVVRLAGHAKVCFHTDGVSDARIGSELFGVQRVQRVLAELEPGAGAQALLDRVAQESDARPDDMAACMLLIEGGPEPPRALAEQLRLDGAEAGSERTRRFLAACGLQPAQVEDAVRMAQSELDGSGGVLIDVRLDDGRPRVSLTRDNVAWLHAQAPRAPAMEALS